MLGKIRIIKRGSGLIQIIERSLSLLFRKGFRVIERIKIHNIFSSYRSQLLKSSNYRKIRIIEARIIESGLYLQKGVLCLVYRVSQETCTSKSLRSGDTNTHHLNPHVCTSIFCSFREIIFLFLFSVF